MCIRDSSVIGAIQRHGQIDDEIRSHENLLGNIARAPPGKWGENWTSLSELPKSGPLQLV